MPTSDSQRLLERVIDTSPDVIYVFDVANGRAPFSAAGCARYSATSVNTCKVSNIADLLAAHPPGRSLGREAAHGEKCADCADGAVATVEYRCRTRDGSYRWFRGKETVVLARQGRQCRESWSASSPTSTSSRRRRIAFTDMNAKLKAILASISDCYLTLDHECRVTNRQCCGRQVVGQGSTTRWWASRTSHVFAGSAARTAVKKANRERRVVHVELPSHLHPGRWIDLRVYPSEDGVNIFFSDITKRKLAEEAAARSKALLNASIDSLSAHIVILDAAGTIVASNKAWRRFAAGQRRTASDVRPGLPGAVRADGQRLGRYSAHRRQGEVSARRPTHQLAPHLPT